MRGRVAIAATIAALASASVARAVGYVEPGTVVPQGMAGFCMPAQENGLELAATVGAPVTGPITRPIAVLDTGVDAMAPELVGRVLPGVDAFAGGAGDGDPDGHGTQVAAIAAANSATMRGVSPNSPILPVKIYNDQGTSSADVLVRGIQAAAQRGAAVITISGAAKRSETSTADIAKISRAINDAGSKGILVVAAAGNDGTKDPSIPASLPHVLVAGGSGLNGLRAASSNAGPWIDVVSPIENMFSTLPLSLCEYGYGSVSGTSYAAPALAGAAALVQAARSELALEQRFELLRQSATDIAPAGRDDETGYGMLNVAGALTAPPVDKPLSAEVDDDIYWVKGTYAMRHPVLLQKTMRFKGFGSLNPAKDPADVYRVHLRKNDRVVVSITPADPAALFELSFLDTKAGDFDITNGVQKNRLYATGGLSDAPQVEWRAKKTGVYYVAVETTDAVDEEDPEAIIPDTQPYRISAFKQRPKAKKKPKKKSRQR